MEVGEVPKGMRWSAEAGGPPKVRIGGVSGRGRGPTIKGAFHPGANFSKLSRPIIPKKNPISLIQLQFFPI